MNSIKYSNFRHDQIIHTNKPLKQESKLVLIDKNKFTLIK